MDEYLTPLKRITIPVYGSVDTANVKEIIDHEAFQHMFRVKQLGFAEFVFPGARHTRGEHMIGAFAQCREYTRALVRKKMLNEEQACDVEIAALLHDVGHGPYSHLFENVLKTYGSKFKNHNERTTSIIRNQLAGVVERSGSHAERVIPIVEKKDPLGQLVSHKTIGADKVAYVRVDQYHAGYPPSQHTIGDLPENLIFMNKTLGADERMKLNLMNLQRHYFDMYREVYLAKGTRALDRIFERSVQWAIESGVMKADEIWPMTDEQLISTLVRVKGPWSDAVNKVFHGPRYSMKAAVVLRMPGHENKEVVRGKPMKVFAIPDAKEFFRFYADARNVLHVEEAIAQVLKIPIADVVFTYVDEPSRLVPQDVQLFDPKGNPTGTLFESWSDHKRALEEFAKGVTASRIMVAPEHRQKACDAAKDIYRIVSEKITSG